MRSTFINAITLAKLLAWNCSFHVEQEGSLVAWERTIKSVSKETVLDVSTAAKRASSSRENVWIFHKPFPNNITVPIPENAQSWTWAGKNERSSNDSQSLWEEVKTIWVRNLEWGGRQQWIQASENFLNIKASDLLLCRYAYFFLAVQTNAATQSFAKTILSSLLASHLEMKSCMRAIQSAWPEYEPLFSI